MENLIEELETAHVRLNEIRELKMKAIDRQNFYSAAEFRDQERKCLETIDILEKKISKNNI